MGRRRDGSAGASTDERGGEVGLAGEAGTGSKPGEFAEFADEVGLVAVAARGREVGPAGIGAVEGGEHATETHEPRVVFRREADFTAKGALEVARREPEILRDGGDAGRFGRGVQEVERGGDGRAAVGLRRQLA